ncbi:MAG: MlaD family protein, partial [Sedimentisphaerales bacterium]|nr:MlaD family protein [Sedimentisphaerales bacterium]
MSDYDAIQKKRNIIVGVFVVIAMIALTWLVFIFGDLPTAVTELRSFYVYVQFSQAPGIERNTPVRFAGYQIGRVVAVKPPEPMRDLVTGLNYHQTLVVMAIDKQFVNIPSTVRVKLMKRG